MADLPIQEDQTPEYQPADPLGDTFANDGSVILSLVGPATGWTVTFATQRDCEFGPHPDFDLEVPVGSTIVTTDKWDPYRFNDGNGRVHASYSSAVGVQVAALRLPVRLEDDPE
jgi:hypothetical protein